MTASVPMMAATANADRNRTLDGLRGFASLSVVFFHLYGNLREEFGSALFAPVRLAFEYGFLGVQIFFVLSGYAIAAAVGDRRLSGRFAGRFALRRSVRLDPPYWASMLLDACVVVVGAQLVAGKELLLPGWQSYLAHIFYVQDLLGIPQIADVYWTLCVEVQFYLFFVLLLWAVQRITDTESITQSLAKHVVPPALFFLVPLSLAASGGWLSTPRGTFVPHWYLFSLGAFVYWTHKEKLHSGWLVGVMALVGAFAIYKQSPQATAGVLTAAVLIAARHIRQIASVFQAQIPQFFGKISYSLYLVHGMVGWSSISLAKRLLKVEGQDLTLAWSMLCFGLVVSVVTAWTMWRVIESPSQRFSRKVRH